MSFGSKVGKIFGKKSQNTDQERGEPKAKRRFGLGSVDIKFT